MTVEMVLNELSLAHPAPSVSNAQQRMLGLVETMQAAVDRGITTSLRTGLDFAENLLLAPAYTLGSWYNDRRVDEVVRTYLLTFSTQKPYLADQPELDQKSGDQVCYHGSRAAIGLGVAHLIDGLPISVISLADWDASFLPITLYWIDDDGEHTEQTSLRHASREMHVHEHRQWIELRLKSTVRNGAELWGYARDFFPNLVFCPAVETQLHKLPKEALPSILRGLFCLQRYCLNWTDGAFDCERLECVASPESPSTLNEYGAERTFRDPQGASRVFSWHAKMGQWRIHFDPAYPPGRLLVGYAGKHLRTAKFH